jgi:hypothetical protein
MHRLLAAFATGSGEIVDVFPFAAFASGKAGQRRNMSSASGEKGRHPEKGPICNAQEGDDHVSPEQDHIGAFGQIQISEDDEQYGLEEENERHRDQISGQSHQTDGQRKEPEYAKHAIVQANPPLLPSQVFCATSPLYLHAEKL